MKNPVPYLLVLTFAVLSVFYAVKGEEECLKGPVLCYECSSVDEPHCHDPFNYTEDYTNLPFVEECNGCCVKIVQNHHTPREIVRRTCTKNIKISLFMVTLVCMKESNGHGHMCFCEDDYCNGSSSWMLEKFSYSWLAALCLLIVKCII